MHQHHELILILLTLVVVYQGGGAKMRMEVGDKSWCFLHSSTTVLQKDYAGTSSSTSTSSY